MWLSGRVVWLDAVVVMVTDQTDKTQEMEVIAMQNNDRLSKCYWVLVNTNYV